jgi:hypothetical protein
MTTTPTTTTPETPEPQPRTWKPTTAGILIILAGIVALIAEIIYMASGDLGAFAGMPWIGSSANPEWALFVTGVVAIAGGIFTLLRKMWWLAIVGVIFSMFFTIWPVLVAGIISIILIAFSQPEFKRTKK